MTDKEKLNAIRAEVQNYIDAAHKAHANITEGNFAHLLSFIDSLQEEPVSVDLEEACEQLAENARKHKAETSSPFFCQTDYKQGVIDGAKWQKEQDKKTIELAKDHAMLAGMNKMKEEMMSKAIDAQCFGFQGAALFSFRLPADKYLVGSEVKVVVINED